MGTHDGGSGLCWRSFPFAAFKTGQVEFPVSGPCLLIPVAPSFAVVGDLEQQGFWRCWWNGFTPARRALFFQVQRNQLAQFAVAQVVAGADRATVSGVLRRAPGISSTACADVSGSLFAQEPTELTCALSLIGMSAAPGHTLATSIPSATTLVEAFTASTLRSSLGVSRPALTPTLVCSCPLSVILHYCPAHGAARRLPVTPACFTRGPT